MNATFLKEVKYSPDCSERFYRAKNGEVFSIRKTVVETYTRKK